MIKIVAFITAKPGIGREAFKAYYETNHAPLISRLLPTIGRYVRNYVEPTPMWRPDDPGPGFDVVTELWFDDQAAFDGFCETIRKPEVVNAIRADEHNFLDPEKTRLHVVEECAALRTPAR